MKKALALVLTLVMVFCMVPSFMLTASATETTIVTHDADYIQQLLRGDGNISIKLDADADKLIEAYSCFETEESDYWNGRFIWTRVGSGEKTIDLNGHRLYVYDQSARYLSALYQQFKYIQKALMIEVPYNASLTVNDSAGGGLIRMDAEMPDKSELRGQDMLMERNIFGVTGGNLTVNGGEIHAGRSKQIYANQATEKNKNHKLIPRAGLYAELCGYCTWILCGTGITTVRGNVTVNGGDIWGRGWDNYTSITRVVGAPNGADDFRDRCAALRVYSNGHVQINGGSFHGRSDADAVQVTNLSGLTVKEGLFDVGTNDWIAIPGLDLHSVIGSTSIQRWEDWYSISPFDAYEGYLGSPVIPTQCIDQQSNAVCDEKSMTVYPLGGDLPLYRIVEDIGIYLNSPLAYETPAAKNEIYSLPDGCSVDSIAWYENGKLISDPSVVYFKEGSSYYAKITLSADNATKFKYTLTEEDISVNGNESQFTLRDDRHILITAEFGKCKAALESAQFSVSSPCAGYTPDYNVRYDDDRYSVCGGYENYTDYRIWYVSDNGTDGWTVMDTDDTFEAGKYYRFSFDIVAGEGEEFAVRNAGSSIQPDISAKVNTRAATVSKAFEQDPSRYVTVTYDFGACPNLIDRIELLTNYPPVDGDTVHYTVSSASDAYYVVGQNSSHYDDYVKWYVSDNGLDDTWTLMGRTSKFEAGKYYRLYVDVHTSAGYEFMTRDLGSIEPYVYPTVNGCYANVIKAYEQDPSEYVTVVYDFGYCNDSVVENIEITDVTAPVAGEKPSYYYNIKGTGYHTDPTANAYYDDWMHNQQLYYAINGIQWWDMTSGSAKDVYENDSFIAGHRYKCRLSLVTDEGYDFLNLRDHDAFPTATVNGMPAEIDEDWTKAGQARVLYEFTCEPQTVSSVRITGIDYPQGGKHPDYTFDTEPSLYCEADSAYGTNNSGIYWYDSQGNMLYPDDTFVEGEAYRVGIKLVPTKQDGVNSCRFSAPVTAYVNGEEVTERLNYDNVHPNSDFVNIYYTFTYVATAAETEPQPDTHVHNMTLVPTSSSTCQKAGNSAYYICQGCHKWFTDANGQNEITNKSTVILPLIPHNYDNGVVTKEATCTETGIRTYTCSACGHSYTEQINKTAHEYNPEGICINCYDWKYRTSMPKLGKATNAQKGITITWSAVKGADAYYVYRKAAGSTKWGNPIASFVTGTSYTDTTAKAGTKYTYTIKAYRGSENSKYDATGLTVTRLTVPSVKVSNETSGIKVSWAKVAGAGSYWIYRKDASSGYKKIGSTTNLSYLDKTAKAGTKYTYTVRAVNGNDLSAYTGVNTVRLATPSVKVSNTKSGPKTTWGKVSGATGYCVYRKTSSGSYAKIATVKTTSYVDKTAKKNVKYYYAVRAYNGKVMSAYTNNGITCKK